MAGEEVKGTTSTREPLLEHGKKKVAASPAATVSAIRDAEEQDLEQLLLVRGRGRGKLQDDGGDGNGKERQGSVCTAAAVLSTTVAVCASFAKGVCVSA
jgi:hypothetical protein